MIDAHCHLHEFSDVEAEIKKCKEAGVTAIISNGAEVNSSKQELEIAKQFEQVWATVGQHPEGGFMVKNSEFIEMANHPKVVAIGECGLDYTPETTANEKAKQRELLLFNVDLAKKTNLPLVVHCRNAFDDIFELIDYDLVQMHCFTGNNEQMNKCVNRGWYISFGGIITFKKSVELREAVARVPEDRLLIETDSPYLSPEPIRGERNFPANVRIIAQAVAEARSTSIDEIDTLTTQNTLRLFSKMKA